MQPEDQFSKKKRKIIPIQLREEKNSIWLDCVDV